MNLLGAPGKHKIRHQLIIINRLTTPRVALSTNRSCETI